MKYPTAFRYDCVVPPGSYQLLKTDSKPSCSQSKFHFRNIAMLNNIHSHVPCLLSFNAKTLHPQTFSARNCKCPTAESHWPFEAWCLHDATLYTSPQCVFMFCNTSTINRAHLSTQHYWSVYLRQSVSSVTQKPALQETSASPSAFQQSDTFSS